MILKSIKIGKPSNKSLQNLTLSKKDKYAIQVLNEKG